MFDIKLGSNGVLWHFRQVYPAIGWGTHTRVLMDVGCGVASFGGYLYDRNVLAMSFAPKDEHEAQVQFALERGIPAISAVMGTQRLVFPSNVYDVVHCARCRVPWHIEGELALHQSHDTILCVMKGFLDWNVSLRRWEAVAGVEQSAETRWFVRLVCHPCVSRP